jgi:hypothetical protein
MGIKKISGNEILTAADDLYKSLEMLLIKSGVKVVVGLISRNGISANIQEKFGVTAISDAFDKVVFSFKFRLNQSEEQTVTATGEAGDDSAKMAVKFLTELEDAEGFEKLHANINTATLEITTANFQDKLLVTHVTKTGVNVIQARSEIPTTGSRISDVAKKTPFYFLLSPSRDQAQVMEMADWANGKAKLFVTASSDNEIATIPADTATDIAAATFARKYQNTAVMYSEDAGRFPDFRWVSERGGFAPASAKWAFAGLSGIIPDDISQDDLNNIESKNANCYTTIAGRDIALGKNGGGTTAGGKFIDIVIGTHWQLEEISKTLFSFLSDDERKTDFSNAGMLIIGQQFRQALEKGRKHFSKSYELHIPKESDFSAEETGSRRLTGVRWLIHPKHAVQGLTINGRIGD